MSQKGSKVFQQSGVIPYRDKNGTVEVLLITTRDRQAWVIPKGGISNGMSPPESAAKEAWEEAGVIGQVNDHEIGTYKYRKKGNIYWVKIYLLPVETLIEDYPEASQRERQWQCFYAWAFISYCLFSAYICSAHLSNLIYLIALAILISIGVVLLYP